MGQATMTQLANQSITTQRYKLSHASTGSDISVFSRFAATLYSRIPRSKWAEILDTLESWKCGVALGSPVDLGALHRAIVYTRFLEHDDEPIPTRIGPTTNGGVAFEWQHGDSIIHVEIVDANSAEYTAFDGEKLVSDDELTWNEDDQRYHVIDS